jgi:hypothetical protein
MNHEERTRHRKKSEKEKNGARKTAAHNEKNGGVAMDPAADSDN